MLLFGGMVTNPQLPQDILAEASVLGAILIRGESFYEVAGILQPKHFFDPRHQHIFTAVISIAGQTENETGIDILTIGSKLKSQKKFEAVGGNDYLDKLVNTVPTAANIRSYADIVLEKYRRRMAIQLAQDLKELALSSQEETLPITDLIEARLFEINTRKSIGVKSLETLVEAVVADAKADNTSNRLKTGWSLLDGLLGGLHRSDLIIVAGRPGQGKTAFAINLASTVAKAGRNVLFFSLELTAEDITRRVLTTRGSVNIHNLRSGRLTDDDKTKLEEVGEGIKDWGIWINDSSALSSSDIISMVRRQFFRFTTEPDLIIVDYIQLVNEPFVRGRGRTQEVDVISKRMKYLAREFNVPVVCLSQLTRSMERDGRPPQLHDLRESGGIEQDADVVMALHADPRASKNTDAIEMQLMVLKHRNGPTGVIKMVFNKVGHKFLLAETPKNPTKQAGLISTPDRRTTQS